MAGGCGERAVAGRRAVNIRATAGILVVALIATITAARCKREQPALEEPEPSLVVRVVKVRHAPMTRELRLLGKTVALRTITIRANAAGRVAGLTLNGGDSHRQGQLG